MLYDVVLKCMKKILDKNFFAQKTSLVARELLGKFLVKKTGLKTHAFMITEVEAYDGPLDKASHAHKGRTPRTEVMFGPPGHFYVYLCYGMYSMLNVVTGPKDYPAAVLIRAVVSALHTSTNLSTSDVERLELGGPGKLTKALKVDRKLNALLAVPESGLWFEDRGVRVKKSSIKKTPRIGVAYAGEWAKKPYRFVLTVDKYVDNSLKVQP